MILQHQFLWDGIRFASNHGISSRIPRTSIVIKIFLCQENKQTAARKAKRGTSHRSPLLARYDPRTNAILELGGLTNACLEELKRKVSDAANVPAHLPRLAVSGHLPAFKSTDYSVFPREHLVQLCAVPRRIAVVVHKVERHAGVG